VSWWVIKPDVNTPAFGPNKSHPIHQAKDVLVAKVAVKLFQSDVEFTDTCHGCCADQVNRTSSRALHRTFGEDTYYMHDLMD